MPSSPDKKELTVAAQLFVDLLAYGSCFARIGEDGHIERVYPRDVCIDRKKETDAPQE